MFKNTMKNNVINLSILLFIFIFIIFTQLKPSFLYNKKGYLRTFGLGKTNCTILPIWLFVIIISILSYLSVLYFNLFK